MAAATDLTTLKQVKEWLSVTGNASDSMLELLISGCSGAMQAYMNRTIMSQAYTEKRDGHGGDTMICGNYPVTSVQSVAVEGLVASLPFSFNDDGIYLTGGYRYSRGKNNVVLAYTAGYVTTPLDLQQACIDTIALRWRERERIGHVSKSLGGETTAFSLKDFPAQVLTLLNQYKKVVPI